MEIFLPSYYKDFRCIAERCRHSCCVGWEISVDDETMEKYLTMGEEVLCHIDDGEIVLCDGERCPFLRADGLCSMICEHGEEYTSVICREHPRFYHRVGDRVEGGIGASCEEACRLILSADSFDEFVSADWCGEIADETDFDTLTYRHRIYEILHSSDDCGDVFDKIRREFNIEGCISDEEANELFENLEYLKEEHRSLFRVGSIDRRSDYEKYYRHFLAYLVFRHMSVAQSYDNMRAVIGFCLMLVSLLRSMACDLEFDGLCESARIISEEIEYSPDNTSSLIFEIETMLI